MGFQDMPEVVLKAASRKGGKVRKPKGLAMLPVEKRREIAAKGGKSGRRGEAGTKQSETGGGRDTPLVERIVRDIDGL